MVASGLTQGLVPSSDPLAVIVFHGIGQQAPFETINGVVEAFIKAHVEESNWTLVSKGLADDQRTPLEGNVNFIRFDGQPKNMLPVAEIELRDPDSGSKQAFHFYELYWAPMTEGVVSFLDVLVFLLKAAWDGATAQIRNRKFSRFTFGKEQDYGILTLTGIQLFFAFFVVVGLASLSAAFFGVIGADILTRFRFDVAAHLPVEPLRNVLLTFAFTTPMLALVPILNAWIQKLAHVTTSTAASWVNFLTLIPLIGGIGWFGVAVIYSLVTFRTAPGIWWSGTLLEPIPATVRWVIFTAVGIYLFTQFYRFVVKSVGDVTAYVSAHAVNRFWQVREAIQARALDIGRSVYVRKGHGPNGDMYYKNVILIAHSLGSVIAYDMLNTLINFELQRCADDLIDIAARTRLFLTCGSPLNKIAFLFRFQTGTGTIPKWRELLNNYRQPLILQHDCAHRPQRWINISCFPDWISGQLKYYEPPQVKGEKAPDAPSAFAHYRINEVRDPEGIIPLAAHTQYFNHRVFRQAIFDALWRNYSDKPPDAMSRVQTAAR